MNNYISWTDEIFSAISLKTENEEEEEKIEQKFWMY